MAGLVDLPMCVWGGVEKIFQFTEKDKINIKDLYNDGYQMLYCTISRVSGNFFIAPSIIMINNSVIPSEGTSLNYQIITHSPSTVDSKPSYWEINKLGYITSGVNYTTTFYAIKFRK